MPIIPDTPGARLRQLRKSAKLSAREVAERLGCTQSAVSNHENGINGIRAATATLYASLFNVSPQWILYGDGDAPEVVTANHRPEGAAVILHQLPSGKARLQVNKVVPYPLALKVLAMLEEGE